VGIMIKPFACPIRLGWLLASRRHRQSCFDGIQNHIQAAINIPLRNPWTKPRMSAGKSPGASTSAGAPGNSSRSTGNPPQPAAWCPPARPAAGRGRRHGRCPAPRNRRRGDAWRGSGLPPRAQRPGPACRALCCLAGSANETAAAPPANPPASPGKSRVLAWHGFCKTALEDGCRSAAGRGLQPRPARLGAAAIQPT
jgi:hypothetical protein